MIKLTLDIVIFTGTEIEEIRFKEIDFFFFFLISSTFPSTRSCTDIRNMESISRVINKGKKTQYDVTSMIYALLPAYYYSRLKNVYLFLFSFLFCFCFNKF